MLHKIIGGKNKSKKVKSCINYLLRKNKINEQQFITVLSTTNELDMLNYNQTIAENKKHPYVCGVLSFEESNIDSHLKLQFMKEFEDILFCGIDQDIRPPVMWIQHTDKGRLELNYVTFNELANKKAYTVYVDKRDRNLVNSWCEMQNLKLNFTSPFSDPRNKQLIQEPPINQSPEEINTITDLNNKILEMILTGEINNRNELVEHLQNKLNLEITRQGKNYITVVMSGKSKRLKGEIYEEGRNYQDYATTPINYNERLKTEYGSTIEDIQSNYEKHFKRKFETINKRYSNCTQKPTSSDLKRIEEELHISNIRENIKQSNNDFVYFEPDCADLHITQTIKAIETIITGEIKKDGNIKENDGKPQRNDFRDIRSRINTIKKQQQQINRDCQIIGFRNSKSSEKIRKLRTIFNEIKQNCSICIKGINRFWSNRRRRKTNTYNVYKFK